ncbi:DUF1565 domain-containing protein [Neosynechococcus sphagnicola]|uniref:DUF1565 domain-containing protein n=1 Tax=Neosynechococcus sphagnicola TaxID=1501145 RepID=UPI00138E51B5|nr:DUF1565 domain-containing protein [Neosynechococcus sphagnicola]
MGWTEGECWKQDADRGSSPTVGRRPDIWRQGIRCGIGVITIALLGLLEQVAPATAAVPLTVTTPSRVLNHTLAQVPTIATLVYVNPATGDDLRGNGSSTAPFKTITQALQASQPNTVIQLAAGTYSLDTGEQFPLLMKPGVTLKGDAPSRGRNIVIRGGGAFLSPTAASQNIALLGANQASIIGVTITNPSPRGYGLWIDSSSPTITDSTFTASTHDGISVNGRSTALIQRNYFYQNGASGISVFGTAQPQVQDNVFENTGFGVNIGMSAAPVLVKNRISFNKDGVVVQSSARPILRDNVIENCQRDGLVAIALAAPDLGSRMEAGRNLFRNNGRFDINNAARNQILLAYGNQFSGNQISGRVDLGGALNPRVAVAPIRPQIPSPVTVNLTPRSLPSSRGGSASGLPTGNGTPTAIEIPVPPPEMQSSWQPSQSPSAPPDSMASGLPPLPSQNTPPS